MGHRDSQTGEYNEAYPLEAFIDALDELGGDVGTKDVEQAVGCQYRTALAKLQELADRGIVTSRRVGNAYLWSLSERSDMQDASVDQGPRNEESLPEEEGSPIDGTAPYDPADEWE